MTRDTLSPPQVADLHNLQARLLADLEYGGAFEFDPNSTSFSVRKMSHALPIGIGDPLLLEVGPFNDLVMVKE